MHARLTATLLAALSLPAAAEYVPKDTRIGLVYAVPLGDVYDSGAGAEFQYRLWYWETTAVSIIGSLQQWELSDSSEFAQEPDFTGFKGSPAFLQIGAGIDEQRELSDHVRLNLHADIRYCNGLSGAKLRLNNGDFSREQTVDVSDAIIGAVGAGLEFEVSREWTLYTEIGLQGGLLPGEIGSGAVVLDNEFEAPLIRAGAVFKF